MKVPREIASYDMMAGVWIKVDSKGKVIMLAISELGNIFATERNLAKKHGEYYVSYWKGDENIQQYQPTLAHAMKFLYNLKTARELSECKKKVREEMQKLWEDK